MWTKRHGANDLHHDATEDVKSFYDFAITLWTRDLKKLWKTMILLPLSINICCFFVLSWISEISTFSILNLFSIPMHWKLDKFANIRSGCFGLLIEVSLNKLDSLTICIHDGLGLFPWNTGLSVQTIQTEIKHIFYKES